MKIPELLSPAGSAPAMVAAVQCGADAVYLGAGDFNARRSADNFGGELDAATLYCHARGAKVYVTLNTMARQDEMNRLEKTIVEIASAGVDGVIVQDFGVARAVRQMASAIPLHASTQMAVHNPQGVEFLVKQGFRRVVLAREMTYAEIRRCANLGAELEVFVHGALCVSCSGQCLMSSMIGGRSGNRGLCAQPCRMAYQMDGAFGHLLSTKDLCSLDVLRELADAGADSLKIEGRLKRPEYVAVTTAAYRGALDALAQNQSFDAGNAIDGLRQMFNRGGFTHGYAFGVDDRDLMYAEQPNHIGVEIGACARNGEIELNKPIDAKDVLALRRVGGQDLPVRAEAASVGRLRLDGARKGDRLIRLVSQAQMTAAQAMFAGERKKFPIDAALTLRVGQPARLTLSDGKHSVSIGDAPVQAALSKPADPQRIRAQIVKLGDTPFVLRNYSAEIDENAFMSVSALNALRRRACEALFEARGGEKHAVASLELPTILPRKKDLPEMIVQSGNPEILQRALEAGCDRTVFAPEDLRGKALDNALTMLPARFSLALPPVMAGETMRTLHAWAQAHAERIEATYISNVGQLNLDWCGGRIADMQMNAANNLTVAQLADWGVSRYTPSVELNVGQLRNLGGNRELIVYGRIPLMQLRHCPLRAARGLVGRHDACRRCDQCAPEERVDAKRLSDRIGAAFPLRRIASDEGCVIQLLNSAVLMPLRRARQLPEADGWRLLIDDGAPVEELVRLYDLARRGGEPKTDPAWNIIEGMNTTTGHYFRGAD